MACVSKCAGHTWVCSEVDVSMILNRGRQELRSMCEPHGRAAHRLQVAATIVGVL